MSDVQGAPSDLLLLVGPVLIGSLFSWLLYGVLSTQLYFYYLQFTQDSLIIQITVYGLYALDTFHTVAITFVAWGFLGEGWGKLEALTHTNWGFAIIPLMSGISSAWVQLFYAWRIYTLGKTERNMIWTFVAVLVTLISLAQGVAGMAAGIKFLSLNDIEEFPIIYASAAIWLAGSAASDVVIAISMVFLLGKAKEKTKFNQSTERLLARLIRMSVETGTITAAAACVDLGFFLGVPTTNLHLLIALGLSKLYTNSLYASLNSRANFFRSSERGSGSEAATFNSFQAHRHQTSAGGPVIHVSTVREVSDSDGVLPMRHGRKGSRQIDDGIIDGETVALSDFRSPPYSQDTFKLPVAGYNAV